MGEVRDIVITQIDQNFEGAPEIFIDGVHGLVTHDHIFRINLVGDALISPTPSSDPQKDFVHRSVKARVIMSEKTFYEIAAYLAETAADFKGMAADDLAKKGTTRE